jgi:hypothetical protein
MPYEQYNLEQLITTAEWTADRDDNGVWRGTATYYCGISVVNDLIPPRFSPHPIWSGMLCTTVKMTGEDGGMVRIDANYDGALGGGGEGEFGEVGEPEYSLDRTVSEEPLETHIRYLDHLSNQELAEVRELAQNPVVDADGVPEEADTAGWDVRKIELYDKLRRGFTSYLDAKQTWKVSKTQTAAPTGVANVGKIDTPEGPAPTLPSDRNWINMGVSYVRRGGLYVVEESWQASDRGGWDADIYT